MKAHPDNQEKLGKSPGKLGKQFGILGKFIWKIRKVRCETQKKRKKGHHLFWAEKLGKLIKIWKVHPENSEKFGKLNKIRKVHPENSESSSGKFGKSNQIRKVPKVRPKQK